MRFVVLALLVVCSGWAEEGGARSRAGEVFDRLVLRQHGTWDRDFRVVGGALALSRTILSADRVYVIPGMWDVQAPSVADRQRRGRIVLSGRASKLPRAALSVYGAMAAARFVRTKGPRWMRPLWPVVAAGIVAGEVITSR